MTTIEPHLLMKLEEKVKAYPEAHVPAIRLEGDYAIKYWDGSYYRYAVFTSLDEEGDDVFIVQRGASTIFYGPKGREILGFIDELFFTSEINRIL